VWASMCIPGMEMGTTPATVAASSASHAPGMSMPAAGHRQLEGPGTDSGSPAAPHCPLAPAPGTCLAFAASLPAHAPESFVPSPEGASAVVPPGDARQILLVSAFFRPPRA
jgi:hypothetical protein